jgi:hypothetical protein
MIDWLGWTATAVFVASYFCASPQTLKRVQMMGALMWIAYGVLIGASPVIVANLLVFAAAAWAAAKVPSATVPEVQEYAVARGLDDARH